jgi:hypothetical protein
VVPHITLFRSITVLCGTDGILGKYSLYSICIWGIFCRILLVPHNIVMDQNDVMIFALENESNMRATLITPISACYYSELHSAIASYLGVHFLLTRVQ